MDDCRDYIEHYEYQVQCLEERIEKLEAALEDMAQYISKADWIQLKPETHQVWDLGEIDD